MRFVFVSTMSGYAWGGSEELWSQTAVQLKERGHEVTASVSYWPQISQKVTALTGQGIAVHVRKPSQKSLRERVWNKAQKWLHQQTADFHWLERQAPNLVIISQGGVADGLEWLTFCRTVGLPYVVISQCNSEAWWPPDKVATEMSAAYLAARKIFCVSQGNLRLLEQQVGTSLQQAEVVRNPYNVPPNQSVTWPAATDIWRLACVARLDPAAKGQDLLFHVLARPVWRQRAIEVNLFGGGPCEQGLRRLAERLQLNQVRFHGHVEDVTRIWTQNHLLVLPSRYEGLPLALVEAMWCARPTLVTAVAGNTELCSDGETGFIAPAPTEDLLAETMERAWEQRQNWQKMGAAARLRVEQSIPKYPITVFCDQLLASSPTRQPRVQPNKTMETSYRHILGVRFFIGGTPEAVELGAQPGLVVVPAAPALMELARDADYRQALLEADLAITDSGFLVLLWNIMMFDSIQRVSGLGYLRHLLARSELWDPRTVLWIMPSQAALQRNLCWLRSKGYPTQEQDCYVAPKYQPGSIVDEELVRLVNERNPRHIIIGLGGGVQEKLGLYLKKNCTARPAIHCIGAAIGFLSGDQVHIPDWADRWILGWLFRCASNPKRFIPRYAKALRLPLVLWRCRDQMPKAT